MRLSVILPTYCPVAEVDAKLQKCLKLIAANTDWSNAELVIVEQGRPVAKAFVARCLESFRRIPFTVHNFDKPMGFARAVNFGVSQAKGEYLLIVNNDVEVTLGWADGLASKYASVPDAGVLFPACTKPQDACDIIEHPHSWWSCVCVSRRVWDDVGPLDEDLLNYRLHDQDFSLRAFMKGYIVGCYRGVTVAHDDCSTYRHMRIDETAERAEMRRRWGVEHFCDHPAVLELRRSLNA